MEYKSAFLILYFGHLPPYFDFWAKSCIPNQENFHWYVYNDQISEKTEYNDAVTVIPYDFDRLHDDINNEFGVKILYEGRRIACDCRLFLYVIREKDEDLSCYDFIGYSDIDMIYGKIKHFMPDNPYQYSMISASDNRPCGPFTLFNKKYIKNILFNDNVKKLMERNFSDKIYNSDIYNIDESQELLRVAKEYDPAFCRSDPLDPARTNRFNYRKSIAFWENGKLSVLDNRGHVKEGAFFHFSRFKNRSRFKINYLPPLHVPQSINTKECIKFDKFGVYKYGIVNLDSKLTKFKMVITTFY